MTSESSINRACDRLIDPYVAHRSLLFTIAYEILGSATDAEDVVQETWLRWADLGDGQADVRDPRAYLVRIVTRQALNRLRTLARRREDYVGEWLPEPVLTGPDVSEDLELAESISMAMLIVLETLTPVERAVFVLREAFDVSYDEIALAVNRTQSAVRQIAHRARERVSARRPRWEVDRAKQDAVVERFMAALHTGDMQSLLDVLAPDVVLIADGGGIASAIRIPLVGVATIGKALSGFQRKVPAGAVLAPTRLNGGPALRLDVDGTLDTAISLVVIDGRISHIFVVRNPEKLKRLEEEVPLGRMA